MEKTNSLLFTITHDISGDTYTGTAKELAELMGVVPKTIFSYSYTGSKIANHWKVEAAQGNQEKKANNIPYELWDEWVRVTAPFKKAIERKKKNGKNV